MKTKFFFSTTPHIQINAVEKNLVLMIRHKEKGDTWDVFSKMAAVLSSSWWLGYLALLSHRCDQGYQGTECHPEAALPSTIMSDFENQNGWESDWQEVIGGEIVKPEQGCGVVSSGSSLYFSKVWPRLGWVMGAVATLMCDWLRGQAER